MKDYTTIDRLLEGEHIYGNNPDDPMPQELLNMTIKDLLDKVASFDSEGDAEYEALKSILDAVGARVSSGSHEGDSAINIDGTETVEVGDDQVTPEYAKDTPVSAPTWSQGESGNDENNSSADDFEF